MIKQEVTHGPFSDELVFNEGSVTFVAVQKGKILSLRGSKFFSSVEAVKNYLRSELLQGPNKVANDNEEAKKIANKLIEDGEIKIFNINEVIADYYVTL